MPAMIERKDLLTEDKLAELTAAHGGIAHLIGLPNHLVRIAVWPLEDGETVSEPPAKAFFEVVFRRPKRTEYKQYKARSFSEAQRADAQEILARQCVVVPSREAFDALLEDYPALPEAAGKAFGRLMGLSGEEAGK